MKKLCSCVLILLLGFAWATAAGAQSTVTVTPAQLTVSGARDAVETRTLLLRATVPITGVQVISLDLASADGKTILPASALRAALPADEIDAGELLTIPVTVDLRGAPAGEFKGEVLITYHGGSLTVPVTATAKDPWWPPLVVLVVGVVLGMGVSAYRARGRPRDEVLVRVGQLRAQMRGDGDLAARFQTRIEACLVDVEAMLQAEKWQDAQAAVGQAEAILIKWRKGRDDWLAQLAYLARLKDRLGDLSTAVPYVQVVRRDLEDAARDAPDLAEPDALRQRLEVLAGQINRYVQLDARLNDLDALRGRLPADQTEIWQGRALDLQQRLGNLRPDDEPNYQALQGEVEAAVADLTALALPAPRPEMIVKGIGVRGLGEALVHLLAPAPSVRPSTAETQLASARIRLRLFTWFSYAVALVVLIGAGFAELYIARPAFGANAWGDYFALLAWGFGSEATRAAVTEMLRGWGLPGE